MVSKRHQAGGDLGYVLRISLEVMEFHAEGGKDTPPHPHLISLGPQQSVRAQLHRRDPLPPAGLNFSPGRVSGLQGIFVVDRYSLKVEGFILITFH